MYRLLPVLAIAALLPATGCDAPRKNVNTVVGSGVAKSEDRAISNVSQIQLSGVGTLILKQSDKESLTIKADDNILPLLKSQVVDGTLTLQQADNSSIESRTPIEYVVEVKSLAELKLSGATHAKATALNGKQLSVSLSGSTHVTLQGTVETLKLDASGASRINADDIVCRSVTVKLSGACNATIAATETLDATADGASQVTYTGDPKLTQRASGASSIKKR